MADRPKDGWEKADVIGKWLIPIAVLIATVTINRELSEREAKMSTFAVAVGILQSPESDKTPAMRNWALKVFTEMTGEAEVRMPTPAIQELQRGEQLPTTSASISSGSKTRVRVVLLAANSAYSQQRVTEALLAGGYSVATIEERGANVFPAQAEVRFYHDSDEAAAAALRQHLANSLSLAARLNNRVRDADASKHRRGDLHVYVR